jgi:hypothetical protein
MENGVIDERFSQYAEARTLCQNGKYIPYRQNLVKDFEYCEQNEYSKQCTFQKFTELLSKGPVIVAMDAEFEGFSKYKPGANFEPAVPIACGKLNHAVLAVGLVTENGQDYLLVRNSWGPTWGKDGYFKISTKNHCGILDNAWLPIVQKHIPFPTKSCPEFYSECDYKGNKVSTCEGESDFEKSIGKTMKSYRKTDKLKDIAMFFNFYTEKDCKGELIWNYDDVPCADNNFNYRNKPIRSASLASVSLAWGCIQHYSESCYKGNSTLICESIPDMSKTDFVFTTGSIMLSTFSIDNVFFFSGIKYTGKVFGAKSRELANYSDNPELFEAMRTAKSIFLNKRDPNKPLVPDW